MKPDRIEKAAELLRLRAYTKHQGRWRIISDTLELSYCVEREYCDCPDWQYHNAGRIEGQHLCKHQFCIFGAAVVLFIVELRQAKTITDIQTLLERHASAIKTALPEYVAIAEREYRAALERIENGTVETSPEVAPETSTYRSRTTRRGGESVIVASRVEAAQFVNGIQIV